MKHVVFYIYTRTEQNRTEQNKTKQNKTLFRKHVSGHSQVAYEKNIYMISHGDKQTIWLT